MKRKWDFSNTSSRSLVCLPTALRVLGLIPDTEKLYFQVNKEICEGFSREYDSDLREKVMGMFGIEAAGIHVEALGLPLSASEYHAAAKQRYRDVFPSARPMPDSEGAYGLMFEEIAANYGKVFSWDLKLKIMGTTEMDSARLMVQELDLPISAEEFTEAVRKIHHSFLSKCSLMPGAERLVKHLHDNGVPIAMATSSSAESMGIKMSAHQELLSRFSHVVTGSSDPEVKRGKPQPDIFLVCASRFSDPPQPEKCLVFEDAPNGVLAGRAAGMQVVMVPDHMIPPEKTEAATLVLSSLEQFKPELFGLPPF
uniref:pseudouridine 5'-phosphatase n=1 Tax=Timema tahoe TaxID=61484 RepID=A0A7R9IDY5_9NEOP|nr:unnamed protein product [Timema tahoe]